MKFLVIGLGSMGKRRIRNLTYLRVGEIIGFDPRADRRAEAADRYGIRMYDNFEAARGAGAHAWIISTPPDRHIEFARYAAQDGAHFFTEASVLSEGMDGLLDLLQGKRIVAAPSCTMRFHPSVVTIKTLLDKRAVGQVLTFIYHSGQYLPEWHPWEDYRSFYAARRETGGCREIVPFELAWLTWLLGDIRTLSCFRGKLSALDADIDDVYQLILRFGQGTLGHLTVDVVSRVPYRTFRLLGEHGVIEWAWSDKRVRLYRADDRGWTEFPEPPGIVEDGYLASEDMYIEEMRCFTEAIRGERLYPYTFADDKRILDLLYAAERSSDQGVHVRVG